MSQKNRISLHSLQRNIPLKIKVHNWIVVPTLGIIGMQVNHCSFSLEIRRVILSIETERIFKYGKYRKWVNHCGTLCI